MKAVIYKKYGPAEVLQIKEVVKPIPQDDELLIRVYSAEVTKADCEMRSFKFAVKWFWLPLRLAFGVFRPKKQVLGGYFSGEVESVGKGVTKFSVSDKVFGSTQMRLGAYAEYLCVPEQYTVVAKPNNMSYDEAAAVPLGGLNALHFMRRACIQKGERVLINGAGGSIGIFAVQLAKDMGAEVTVVDSAIKEEMLVQLGVDHFFDYAKRNVTKNGQTYDVIFNMVAKSRYSDFIKILNPEGRYLLGNPRFSDMCRSIVTSKFTSKKVIFAFASEKLEELVDLKNMIEAGKINAIIDKVYPCEQVVDAHKKVEAEQRIGCVVLSFGIKHDL